MLKTFDQPSEKDERRKPNITSSHHGDSGPQESRDPGKITDERPSVNSITGLL